MSTVFDVQCGPVGKELRSGLTPFSSREGPGTGSESKVRRVRKEPVILDKKSCLPHCNCHCRRDFRPCRLTTV